MDIEKQVLSWIVHIPFYWEVWGLWCGERSGWCSFISRAEPAMATMKKEVIKMILEASIPKRLYCLTCNAGPVSMTKTIAHWACYAIANILQCYKMALWPGHILPPLSSFSQGKEMLLGCLRFSYHFKICSSFSPSTITKIGTIVVRTANSRLGK